LLEVLYCTPKRFCFQGLGFVDIFEAGLVIILNGACLLGSKRQQGAFVVAINPENEVSSKADLLNLFFLPGE
jgi:hypothetical protein